VERAAALLSRLLTDGEFRAGFRRDPAGACVAYGLPNVARELAAAGKALHTLEVRESRSSLAGALLAAAGEGVETADQLAQLHASGAFSGEASQAVGQALTSVGLPPVPPAPAPEELVEQVPLPAPEAPPAEPPGETSAEPEPSPPQVGGEPPAPPAPPAEAEIAPEPPSQPAADAPATSPPETPSAPAAEPAASVPAAEPAVSSPAAAVPPPAATDPPTDVEQRAPAPPRESMVVAALGEPIRALPSDRSTLEFLPRVEETEASVSSAVADVSGASDVYPGDDASPAAIAAWMAVLAERAGLPRELPVMAALTESGLRNLNYGDRDSVGFFQMRTGIWDRGEYAGYGTRPELQMRWFVDHALAVRDHHVEAGNAAYGKDERTWGEWIADVERPAAEYRHRYQLRLEEARSLIAAGGEVSIPGVGEAPPGPAQSDLVAAETAPPVSPEAAQPRHSTGVVGALFEADGERTAHPSTLRFLPVVDDTEAALVGLGTGEGALVTPIGTPPGDASEFLVQDAEGAPSADGVRFHAGKDWFAPAGTPVVSPASGTIVEVTPSRGSSGQIFGGVVKVQEPSGRVFVFRHVDPVGVELGQQVAAGTPLATVSAWTGVDWRQPARPRRGLEDSRGRLPPREHDRPADGVPCLVAGGAGRRACVAGGQRAERRFSGSPSPPVSSPRPR
jgi:hypothetical protein